MLHPLIMFSHTLFTEKHRSLLTYLPGRGYAK